MLLAQPKLAILLIATALSSTVAISSSTVTAKAAINVCESIAYVPRTTLPSNNSYSETWAVPAGFVLVAGVFNQDVTVSATPYQTDWMEQYTPSLEVFQGTRNDSGSSSTIAGWFGLDYQC